MEQSKEIVEYPIKDEWRILFNLFLEELPWLKEDKDFQEDGYVFCLPNSAFAHVVFDILRADDVLMKKREINGIENFVNKYFTTENIKDLPRDYLDFEIKDSIIDHLMVDDKWKKVFHFKGEALKRVNEYVSKDERFNKVLFSER